MTVSDADLPYLIPIAVVSVWWLAMFVLSRVSGWAALAEAYATDEDFEGSKTQLQSLSLTRFGLPANYNNVVTIGADAAALRLSLFLFFRPFHSPLKIPFADLTARRKKVLVFESVELTAARAPYVKIALPRDRAAWIEAVSAGALRVPA